MAYARHTPRRLSRGLHGHPAYQRPAHRENMITSAALAYLMDI